MSEPVNWDQLLEPGPIKIDTAADERKLAEQDASAYGVGYLVDGKRVHPSRVMVIDPTPERTDDEQG